MKNIEEDRKIEEGIAKSYRAITSKEELEYFNEQILRKRNELVELCEKYQTINNKIFSYFCDNNPSKLDYDKIRYDEVDAITENRLSPYNTTAAELAYKITTGKILEIDGNKISNIIKEVFDS